MRTRTTIAAAAAALLAVASGTIAVAATDAPPRIAFVARGDGTNFADALAVGSVAGQLGAPVFTTPGTALAADTASALAAHAPELVVIAGGEAAVSADVEAEIETVTGLTPDRVVRAAGTNRYATAAEIAGIFDRLGIDAAFLPTDGIAADADRLDGLDASAFLPADSTATNADRLDGLDASAFLPADGTATNADRLDGLDASAFATSGQLARAVQVTSQAAFVDAEVTNGSFDSFTVDVPVQGTLVLEGTTTVSVSAGGDATAFLLSLAVDDPSCDAAFSVAGTALGSVAASGPLSYDSASPRVAYEVTAGTHTVHACIETQNDAVALYEHAVTATFVDDGGAGASPPTGTGPADAAARWAR